MTIFGQLGFYSVDLFLWHKYQRVKLLGQKHNSPGFLLEVKIPSAAHEAVPQQASTSGLQPPLLPLALLLPLGSSTFILHHVFLECLLCDKLSCKCKGYRRKQNWQNPSLHTAFRLPILFLFYHIALFYCLHVLVTL